MTTAADQTLPDPDDEARRTRWESTLELPLTAAAVAFLAVYAWPILEPSVGTGVRGATLRVVSLSIWAVFIVDYLVRFWLSRHRARFVRQNLLDLAAVALPVFRPLRALRLVKVLGVMNRNAGDSLRGRVAVYVAGSTFLVVLVASLAMLDAERGRRGANIETLGDALWWAVSTVTTVGYGDHYPVTVEGRFIACGLMLAGIALLGVVTASFASWLIDRVSAVEEESQAATRRDVRALTVEVAALRSALEARELREPSASGADPGPA